MSAQMLFPTQIPPEYRVTDVHIDSVYHADEDPSLTFSMLAPHWWAVRTVKPAAPGQAPPTQLLATYTPTDIEEAELNVFVMDLGREVAPADFLESQLVLQGETILEKRTAPTDGGEALDILSRARTDGRTTLLRRLAIKDGRRMFILRALALEKDYESLKQHFAVALSSFNPLNPNPWPLAESLKSFSRSFPSDFVLFYPESWSFAQDPVITETYLQGDLINKVNEQQMGRLLLTIMSRSLEPDRQRLVEMLVEPMKPLGLGTSLAEVQPIDPPQAFEAAWAGLDRGGDPPLEGRLVVAQRPDAWFTFLLLGPSRENSPTAWAINKRALDIVLGFLRTPDHMDLPAFIAAKCAPRDAQQPEG